LLTDKLANYFEMKRIRGKNRWDTRAFPLWPL